MGVRAKFYVAEVTLTPGGGGKVKLQAVSRGEHADRAVCVDDGHAFGQPRSGSVAGGTATAPRRPTMATENDITWTDLASLIGRTIVAARIIPDRHRQYWDGASGTIVMALDDGRQIAFEAAEVCGDNPVVCMVVVPPNDDRADAAAYAVDRLMRHGMRAG